MASSGARKALLSGGFLLLALLGPTGRIHAQNPVPSLSSLSPNNSGAGDSAFAMTVFGSNFISGSVVRWNGSDRTTTFFSSSALQASISASDVAVGGTAQVTVFNPSPGGGSSNALTFTITATPSLSSISPNNAGAGQGGFSLTVFGSGFINTSVVRWNGSDRTTTFFSSSSLQASIPASDVATAGTAQVTVNNPPPGGGTSNALTFTITGAPSLSSISPTNAGAGESSFSLTVFGNGFINTSVVRWNGSDRPTTFFSSSSLQASISASDVAAGGTAQVTVNNPPPGAGTSNAVTFTIIATPSISTLSPSSATAGGAGFNLTVFGSGFIRASVVRWNSSDRPTTFFSSGSLQASIPSSDLATGGTAQVTVNNAPPGGGVSNAVNFTITGGTCTYSISPTSQSFSAGSGSGSVAVTAPAGCTWTATSNASWLTVTAGASGSGNATVSYSVAANTSTSSRTGTITIAGQTFTVTQAAPVTLVVSPSTLTFSAQAGGSNPAAQSLTVSASDGSAVAFTATPSTTSGGNWLSASPLSGTTPGNLSASVNIAGLSAGTYTGQVSVSLSSGSPTTVPVTLSITAPATVNVSPSSLTFAGQAGGSNPASQSLSLSVSGGGAFNFTVTVTTTSGGGWLSASPTSGVGPASVSVSANISGLAAGTYNGTVTVTASGGAATNVPVTLNIASPTSINVSPGSLTFTAQAGASNPASQSLALSVSGGGAFNFTVAVATTSGGGWLSASPTSGVGPANVSVSASITGLVAGSYNGTVTVSPSGGGTSTAVPVTLTISTPASIQLSVLPSSLTFSAQAGAGNPAAQSVQVTASNASAISFTATASATSGGNWLAVSPGSGSTPATLTVSANISGLPAGTYQGTVTVQSPQATPSTQTLSVSLSLQAPASLSVQPTLLSFQGQTGAGNPALQTLLISNPGGGALNWTAQAVTQSGGPWLAISPNAGATPAIISVSINATGLAAGTYQGTVTVQAPQASPGTQTVTVTLAITAATSIQLSLQPSSLSFQVTAGAGNPPPQTVVITSSGTSAIAWSAQVSTQSGGAWLSVSPASASTPAGASISVNAAGLAAGTYRGTVTVQAPAASPSTQSVAVTLAVQAALSAQLAVDPTSLTFQTTASAGNPAVQALRISNAGSGTLDWTVTPNTGSGGSWLVAFPSSGLASAASPAVVQIGANVASLAAGTYAGSLRVDSSTTGETKMVSVTALASQVVSTLLVSETGMSFTGVEGAGPVPTDNFGILNVGQGVMSWTVQSIPLSGGSWLSVSPSSGASSGNSLQIPLVDVAVSASGLAAGQYNSLIRVDAVGANNLPANNSPQFLSVQLTVLPAGSTPPVLVRPTGLIFAAPARSPSTSPQNVSLSTAGSGTLQARIAPNSFDGGNWLDAAPRTLTIAPASPATVAAQPSASTLGPGIYSGALTVLFSDGTSQLVNVLFSVVTLTAAPSEGQAAGPETAAACVPNQLFLAERKLGLNFLALTNSPTNIEVELKDNCGNRIPSAPNQPMPDVRAVFSNGDPSLPMVHVGNGIYQGTWQPASAAAQASVKIRADLPGLGSAEVHVLVTLKPNLTAAALSAGSVVSAASFASGVPVAPGSIVAVFGRNMASGTTGATSLPLTTALGGASLNVAGVNVPLFFTSSGQINAQLPFNLAPNSRPQAVVRTRLASTGLDVATLPQTITVAPAMPGIFTTNSQGTGQGAILVAGTATVAAPAGSVSGQDSRPVRRGQEFIAIFATGLGDVTNRPPLGAPASSAPPSLTLLTPTVTIGGLVVPAGDVNFSGLAPFFVGLYQVNAKVPADAPTGDAVPVTITIGGVSSNVATIAVQ